MNKILFAMVSLIVFSLPIFSHTNNPDKPLNGRWDFQLKKIWEIEEAGEDIIGEIQNIRMAKDGRVYIADSKNFKIYIFSKEGKYISFFGQKGEGPGEIKKYQSGDQLFVVDNSAIFCERGRISYFTLDGTYKKILRISNRLIPRTFISEDIFISAPAVILNFGNKTEKIMLFNAQNQSEKEIAQFKAFEKAIAYRQNKGRQVSVRMIFNNITPMMFVKYINDKIYYGMSDRYHIDIITPEGKKMGSFSIDQRKPIKISKAYKKELGEGFGDIPQDMVKEILNALPETASYFQNIILDKSGLVYIFISNPNNERLQAIDIFSPEGRYLYSSEIKAGDNQTIIDTFIKGDVLLLGVEDENGNQKIVKYSIQLPSL